jgi:hypothetical protein
MSSLVLRKVCYITLRNGNKEVFNTDTNLNIAGFGVILGANFLLGDGVGMFGQYYKNDMIYTKMKYSF